MQASLGQVFSYHLPFEESTRVPNKVPDLCHGGIFFCPERTAMTPVFLPPISFGASRGCSGAGGVSDTNLARPEKNRIR